jgi:hypothetical protein
MLLKQLTKETATDHPDKQNLESATEKMNQVSQAINERKRTKELLAR